ncbi:hypothetical protein GCM10007385_06850 [Tateyamaria omphalii]|uniref:hypothetical protein n=1 Tax=Tateyamaria omphalii TaxID=299262 RepID=UPI00167267B7|nr:hypothetical protein [Tateyamaria omphalii]GGX41914.1 hypothetical protein GCM10007385_06850 [Tateyamaria omphalii]
MADLDRKNLKFDVDTASLADLQQIQSMIMGRIVQDIQAKADPTAMYDSHGSNHTNHSDAVAAAALAARVNPGNR